jgi:hypothetical protein
MQSSYCYEAGAVVESHVCVRVCMFQPAWWDAVCKVPPLGTLPRIKKKSIRRITFIEDRLIRYVPDVYHQHVNMKTILCQPTLNSLHLFVLASGPHFFHCYQLRLLLIIYLTYNPFKMSKGLRGEEPKHCQLGPI